MIKERYCPFCNLKLVSGGNHIYTCKQRDFSLTKTEIKLKFLEYNFGDNILDNVCNDYNNLYSLPMLKEKYNGIDNKSVYFLLSLKNINPRNISESAIKISQQKMKKTLQEKYGDNIINPGQIPTVKEKVKKTFLKHYGVDNVWKLANYNKKCAELHPETHKIHMKKIQNGCKKFWDNITEEQLNEWCIKVSKGKELNNNYQSNLENRFCQILNNLNISFTRQFHIKGYNHPYDFHLINTKIIIEINGDYWHANPIFYNENDVISYPGKKSSAKEIWNKDKKLIEIAEKNNYKVITIWENEINSKTNNELEEYFIYLLKSI